MEKITFWHPQLNAAALSVRRDPICINVPAFCSRNIPQNGQPAYPDGGSSSTSAQPRGAWPQFRKLASAVAGVRVGPQHVILAV